MWSTESHHVSPPECILYLMCWWWPMLSVSVSDTYYTLAPPIPCPLHWCGTWMVSIIITIVRLILDNITPNIFYCQFVGRYIYIHFKLSLCIISSDDHITIYVTVNYCVN